jgi:electron transport complex protein RnfG
MEKGPQNYIIQAWLVLLLAFCFSVSLAAVQLTLSPKIEMNKINETRQKVPELVLGAEGVHALSQSGQSLDIESRDVQVEKNNKKIFYKVFRAIQNGKPVGWVVKSSGQGYADKIELLIGFDDKMDAITGLFILEQKETPGLGNKISNWDWRKQFIGKGTDQPLTVVKTGSKTPYDIDAITGATISSRSVCALVNRAISDLKNPLSESSGETATGHEP